MNSFIGWIGGKRQLRKEIIKRFPENYDRYIEVFGGAGWVLFGKEINARQIEIFNDLDGELINLFRCIKYHCEALQKEIDWLLDSREIFFDYVAQRNIRGLTDIQRAARFFYLIKISFGSTQRSFATSPKNIENAKAFLTQVRIRLKNVIIENKDFESVIKIYDRKGALFYLDPPYVATEKYYKISFKQEDHYRLAETLKNIQGKFILSYNEDEVIQKLYSWCHIEKISRNETLSSGNDNQTVFKELIIKNY